MISSRLSKLKLPVIFSSILELPFIAFELINRRSFHEGFPFVLFGTLWLLPIPFFIFLLPIVQNAREEKDTFVKPIQLLLKVALLALIAILWSAIIFD